MSSEPVVLGGSPLRADQDGELFVYAVLCAADASGTSGPPAPDLIGVADQPVQFVLFGDLATAVSVVDPDRPPSRRADLLAYESVLRDLAEEWPVVPVRFGTVMPDLERLVAELVLPRREQFTALLASLRGHQQFNLRAVPVEDAVLADVVAGSPEIRELRERTKDVPEEVSYRERVRLGELVSRALEERSTHDANLLMDVVVPLAAAHRVRALPSATQVLDVALLVDRDRSDEFVGGLEELAEAVHETIEMTLLGPLAPFDFVGDASWD
ncbi:MAG: GvpL/GvpF family gas vesicle protein [Intrasporangium sp.]|uniref:GvpL/GvpF family gas vesicle protein n=1 Tax=Intrasporangium sp. TaxID=1925024 RepID=UPI003F7D800C